MTAIADLHIADKQQLIFDVDLLLQRLHGCLL